MVRRALHLGLAVVACVGVALAAAELALSATILTPRRPGFH